MIRNYPKYRYICLWGYENYISESIRLRDAISKIYFDLKPKRKMSDFYRKELTSEYVSSTSFIVSLNNIAFGSSDLTMKFNVFKRMKKIEKAYRRYKK